jgi:hypothetical protein
MHLGIIIPDQSPGKHSFKNVPIVLTHVCLLFSDDVFSNLLQKDYRMPGLMMSKNG